MQKWEYKVVHGWLPEEDLNKLGAEGWELVTYIYESNDYIFKRPKS